MSWFKFAESTSKSVDHPNFSEAARIAKRKKLENDRLFRHQVRKQRQEELKSIEEGRRLEKQALSDLFDIQLDIFEDKSSIGKKYSRLLTFHNKVKDSI